MTLLRAVWGWIVLGLEHFFYGINKTLWVLVWPFRMFTARHHDRVAAEYDRIADRLAPEQDVAARELRELARQRRVTALRLR